MHTFCTPFAHLPESGAFLCMACTACFPLHKNGTCRGEAPPSAIADRSVTQTPHWGVCCFANAKALGEQGSRQFSAFVCIHQPDGFKDLPTGDFCCRRLFVLPGLGCCWGQVLGIEVLSYTGCGWTFWFYEVVAGYPMQTVMRFSRCGTDLAIKNRHTAT